MDGSGSGVDLRLDVRQTPDALLLEVEIANRRDEAIFVNAHAGNLEMDAVAPCAAYVDFLSDGSILRVNLFPPHPPEGDWIGAAVPLSRLLAAGGVYRATLRLPRPIKPWSPYDQADDAARTEDGVVLGEATTLEFATRWFPEAGVRWIQPGPDEETWWCTGSPTLTLRATSTLDPAIPVTGMLIAP